MKPSRAFMEGFWRGLAAPWVVLRDWLPLFGIQEIWVDYQGEPIDRPKGDVWLSDGPHDKMWKANALVWQWRGRGAVLFIFNVWEA